MKAFKIDRKGKSTIVLAELIVIRTVLMSKNVKGRRQMKIRLCHRRFATDRSTKLQWKAALHVCMPSTG